MASFRRRTPRALPLYAVAETLSAALLATDVVGHRARNAQRVRPMDDAFVIDVLGAFLGPGTYMLTGERLVARYALRVTR